MPGSDDHHLPDDLEPIARMLREQRAEREPLEMDRLKQRVLARHISRPERRTYMRSRIVTVLAALGLIAGSGGALALANSGSGGANSSASTGQYCPPKSKRCKKHHHHHGHHGHHGHHHHHHPGPPPRHHHGGPPHPGVTDTVVISARYVKPFGWILVNGSGHTLYAFTADNDSRVTCTGTCATVWPPTFVPAGFHLVGTGRVITSMLGLDADPTGGEVATYNGWPLYSSTRDTVPGSTNGEGMSQFGGSWYVVSPSGQLIKK